ncbi:MAG: symmetrical bis(5'-nucleosyl)-tetraphosphatase [Ectothiorhodospiraceae bacterium]|nr:symmetrical bis(5'-nucleosyl)-tetraphosphatase [Ectothiorhodospiraceae bacterium]MCH8505448.1 symmetrical bis(5'-nucleosyl)-tetraphosphatase [Ectothiorhodospiraceae bacterium]
MAVYCVGDIQGCQSELLALLDNVRFDPASDRLWLVGDLVNRGPQSVDVLRFVKSLGDSAVTVLGNHDIHLLAAWNGAAQLKTADTLQQVLEAPDNEELLEWLRRRPLLHHDAELGYVMLHAGLLPAWTLDDAIVCAREAEAALAGERFPALMENLYGDEPSTWSPELQGWDRLRFIINAFTRMRYCDSKGRLLLDYKGAPGSQPPGYLPWFEVPQRAALPGGLTLVSGHWSTLGFHEQEGLVTLDTGCLWGGQLTAVRLDGPRQRFSLPCKGSMTPGPG